MSTLLIFRCPSSSHQAVSTITKIFSPRNGGKNFLSLRFQSLQVYIYILDIYIMLKHTWVESSLIVILVEMLDEV